MWLNACVDARVRRLQKRALDPLEFEFQVVVSHLMWVLRPKTGSSRIAGSPLPWSCLASLLCLLFCALVTDNFPFNFGEKK